MLNLQINGESYIPIAPSLWTHGVSMRSVLPWLLQGAIRGCLCLGLPRLSSRLRISTAFPYAIVKNIEFFVFSDC